MSQYRKQILTDFSKEYPEINYDEIQDYEMDKYNYTEPYQNYSNYELPVGKEFSNETFNHSQGTYNISRTRTYFRPISYTEIISEYNNNKYGHIKFPNELYYVSICPYCGAENFFLKKNQNKLRNENINANEELCENCRKKFLANQKSILNAEQLVNNTLSPNENQSVYIMSKDPLNIGIKKCTCKRRIINLSTKNNVLLTEDKDIVNQKSQNLKTETVSNLIKSDNIQDNMISKEKGNEICDKININENIQINNNLVSDTEKINNNEVVPSQTFNVNEQNIESDKILEEQNENQEENVNEKIQINNIDKNDNDEIINEKEMGLGEDVNIKELNDKSEENKNDININENKEESLNLEGRNNLELNKNAEVDNDYNQNDNQKDNENEKDIPQDFNNIEKSNENPINEINQNEGEQNELLNYYENKIDEKNYYDNENGDNNDEKENNLLNSNENNKMNLQYNMQEEVEKVKIINENQNNGENIDEFNEKNIEDNKELINEENKEIIVEDNKEEIDGDIKNENIVSKNINEIEQNEGNKINNAELEKDEVHNDKLDINILDKKIEQEDSQNKKQEEKGEFEEVDTININANGIEQIEKEDDENNIDNNLAQNEIEEKEINDEGKEDNQILNNDNNNLEIYNKHEEENKKLEDYNLEDNVNIESQVYDEKNALNQQENSNKKDNEKKDENQKKLYENQNEKIIDDNNLNGAEQNEDENKEENIDIINKKAGEDEKNKNKEVENVLENNMDDNNENFNDNINENGGEFEEIEQMTNSKNIMSNRKSNSKTKIKMPQSGEEIFHSKKSKKKNIHHLFTKLELKEISNLQQRYSVKIKDSVPIFKKAKEIFPSKYGIEMPYKSHFSHSNYSFKISRSVDKAFGRRTISEKKRINDNKLNGEYMIREFDYNGLRDSQFKMKKYGRKNYYMYKGTIRSENPFVGLSLYDKIIKERKSLIKKTVKKEGIEFNEILSLKENIIKKKDLNNEEIKQLINTLSKFLYEDKEKNLENKESYEYKLHNVSNIIKFINKEKQKKIMEGLQKRAKDEYSKELFEILKSKIDDYKEKLSKVYKMEIDSGNKPHNSKLNSPYKKLVKKYINRLGKNKL